MKFKIDPRIFETFPGLQIGIVVAKGIDNTGEDQELLDMLKQQQEHIRQNFEKETLSEKPPIGAWRKAFSTFGAKPKKYKCSVENLYRMTLEGIDLQHINKLVDLYNYISLKNIIPVGGDDIDKVEGDIFLTFAKGDEKFEQLNTKEIKHPKEGEVIYRDDKEVLCRRWNWRECDKTKMTEQTKNVTLVVEGLPPFTKEAVTYIINQLSELVKKHCGGETTTFILSEGNKETEI